MILSDPTTRPDAAPSGAIFGLMAVLMLVLALAVGPVAAFAAPLRGADAAGVAESGAAPDAALAAALFGLPAGDDTDLTRVETPAPAWRVSAGGRTLGLIGSTWELAGSTGYSGHPLDVLVALTAQGQIAGARLMRHNEPVLTLGISDADIARYVDGFAGYDIARPPGQAQALPDVISRATVSTGVIRDGILRTARVLASAQGVGAGRIDRVAYRPADWAGLIAMGALAHARVTMQDAARALPGARPPVTPSDAPWFEMWTGLIDTPTVGRNLLGQRELTELSGRLGPGEVLLAVLSRGAQSHRGSDWKRAGRFDRIEIAQGDVRLTPMADAFFQIARLPVAGAPEFKERSVFRLNADPAAGGIDVTRPFRVTVTTARAGSGGQTLTLPVVAEVALPAEFRLAASAPDLVAEPPLWEQFWWQKRHQIAVVGVMLAVLGLILFAQEWLVRRPVLWRRLRLGYLATTLLVLGWGLGAQLSIVQVFAFLHALLSGFRWETFLIAPLIFVLWGAVALGMLFWTRGVLRLAVPVRRAARTAQSGRAAAGPAPDRRAAGAARTVVGDQIYAVRRVGRAVVLFDGTRADLCRGRAVQDRDLDAFRPGLAIRSLCRAAVGGGAVHRAVLLPLCLPAGRGAGAAGQA